MPQSVEEIEDQFNISALQCSFFTGIVKSLLKMPDDCMRHFRLKTRYLMDRLVRKFGYDLVSAIVPKDNVQMHKRLKNIKKVQVKKKKDKDARAAAAAGDEDDDSDDMADEKFKVWVAMFLVDLTLET